MCGIKEEQALQADEARSIKALRLERSCYVRRPGWQGHGSEETVV